MSNALLLAEPEAATRGFLERHLRQDGFDVVEAHDGEALALLELTRPVLVLASDSLAADLCRRAQPSLHEGAAPAGGLGLPIAGSHANAGLARLPAPAQARRCRRRLCPE